MHGARGGAPQGERAVSVLHLYACRLTFRRQIGWRTMKASRMALATGPLRVLKHPSGSLP